MNSLTFSQRDQANEHQAQMSSLEAKVDDLTSQLQAKDKVRATARLLSRQRN